MPQARLPAPQVPQPPQTREPNWPLLEALAAGTGGRLNPEVRGVPAAPAPSRAVPLAPLLLGAAALVFLAELIARRLRDE